MSASAASGSFALPSEAEDKSVTTPRAVEPEGVKLGGTPTLSARDARLAYFQVLSLILALAWPPVVICAACGYCCTCSFVLLYGCCLLCVVVVSPSSLLIIVCPIVRLPLSSSTKAVADL